MPKSSRARRPDAAPLPSMTPVARPASSASPISERPMAAHLNALQDGGGNRAVQRLVSGSRAPVQRTKTPEELAAEAAAAEASGGVTPSTAPPVVGPGGLAPIALPAKYAGEDKAFAWRAYMGQKPDAKPDEIAKRDAKAKTTGRVTKYYSPEEQAANTLTPRATEGGGTALTRSDGSAATFGPSTYAMSPAGQVVHNPGGDMDVVGGQEQMHHHSAMFAGGDVAHAGHIGAKGGEVNYLDDDSGHYRPDEAHTFAAFNELAKQGVLNPNSATGRVNLVDKKGEKGLSTRGESASVHFSGYQQAGGDETNIRNKGAMLKQLTDRFKPKDPTAKSGASAEAAAKAGYGPITSDVLARDSMSSATAALYGGKTKAPTAYGSDSAVAAISGSGSSASSAGGSSGYGQDAALSALGLSGGAATEESSGTAVSSSGSSGGSSGYGQDAALAALGLATPTASPTGSPTAPSTEATPVAKTGYEPTPDMEEAVIEAAEKAAKGPTSTKSPYSMDDD